MAVDKRKAFEEIDAKLNEVRILCNRAQIPFFWAAALGNTENGTEYALRADVPDRKNILKNYTMNGISPMSIGLDLKDDRIRELFKIMNGFRAVPANAPYRDTPEIELGEVVNGNSSGVYKKEAADDGDGTGLYLDMKLDEEPAAQDDDEIQDPDTNGYPENDAAMILSLNSGTLPRIGSDFN